MKLYFNTFTIFLTTLFLLSACTVDSSNNNNLLESNSEDREVNQHPNNPSIDELSMEEIEKGVLEELLNIYGTMSISNDEFKATLEDILINKYGYNDLQIAEYYQYILDKVEYSVPPVYNGEFNSEYEYYTDDYSNGYDGVSDDYEYENKHEIDYGTDDIYQYEYDFDFEEKDPTDIVPFDNKKEEFYLEPDRTWEYDRDNDGALDYDKGGVDRDLDNDDAWDYNFGGTDRDLDNDWSWDYNQGGYDRDLDNDGSWDYNQGGYDYDLNNDGFWD